MLDETLAVRYAEALYGLARGANRASAQLDELKMVQQVLQEHSQLQQALESPAVPGEVKKRIAHDLFAKRVKQDTLHFLYLVIDKQRERYFAAMVRSFEKMLQADEGVVEAKVEVPFALDEAARARVLERLTRMTGKKIKLDVEVRPELLAGAVVTVGDRLYDGSFSSQLEQIRDRLVRAQV